MADRLKLFDGLAPDALGWRIESDEVGMVALERLQLFQQRVELGVGDFRILENVIAFFMMTNQIAKLGNASCGIHDGWLN